MQDEAQAVEEDISRLDTGIRQLKVQYDMFFAGALPREPLELRHRVERLIKRYAHASFGKYRHRFQFNGLVARYNSLSELWGKTVRSREVGERPAPAVAELKEHRDRVLAQCRVIDPKPGDEALRRLHAKFVKARQRAGLDTGQLTFEKFARKITAQARQIRDRTQCENVELRVVHSGGKVLLKARPGH